MAPVQYEPVASWSAESEQVRLISDQQEAKLLIASFTELLQPEFQISQLEEDPVGIGRVFK